MILPTLRLLISLPGQRRSTCGTALCVFLQVSYGTWFGANVEFIHGIQVGLLAASPTVASSLSVLEHCHNPAILTQH